MLGNLTVGYWVVSRFTASERPSFVSLQRQLGKNIKFGQPPPNAIPMKKADSGGAPASEEDPFLTSPVEVVTQQDLILSEHREQSKAPPGNDLITHKAGGGWAWEGRQ